MSIEENKRLVRRYFEDAPRNPDACDEIFAPTFQFHAIVHTGVTPQTVESSPEDEKAFYEHHQSVWGGWHFKIEEMIASGAVAKKGSYPEDALLETARQLAREHTHVSTSFLQRKLHIGYPRAARIMEQLEEEDDKGEEG